MGFKEEFLNQPIQSLGVLLVFLYTLLVIFNIIIKKIYIYIINKMSNQTIEVELEENVEKKIYGMITARELIEGQQIMREQALIDFTKAKQHKIMALIVNANNMGLTEIKVNNNLLTSEMKYNLKQNGYKVEKKVKKFKCFSKPDYIRIIKWGIFGINSVIEITDEILEGIDKIKK